MVDNFISKQMFSSLQWKTLTLTAITLIQIIFPFLFWPVQQSETVSLLNPIENA